jgi:hypothetical protein
MVGSVETVVLAICNGVGRGLLDISSEGKTQCHPKQAKYQNNHTRAEPRKMVENGKQMGSFEFLFFRVDERSTCVDALLG